MGEILFLIHISSTTMKAASAMHRHGGSRNKAGWRRRQSSRPVVASLYYLVHLGQILVAAELRLEVLKRQGSTGKPGHSVK
jgi:hypothetical protein